MVALTQEKEAGVAALVEALIGALEAGGVRYAILRNHELYPRFGNDVDLLVHGDDLDGFRAATAAAAAATGFDAVTECRHWAQSGIRAQDFLMFRFYRTADLAFIKVDAFHGYSLLGLPFMDEAALLDGRVREPRGRFAIVDPVLAEVWRLCQLANEIGGGRGGERTERYRQRVLACAAARGPAFEAALDRFLPGDGRPALAALEARDEAAFLARMRRARRRLLLRHLARSPLGTPLALARRAVALLRTRLLNPCGFDLRVQADDPAALETALARLRAAQFLSGYAILQAGARRPGLRARLRGRHLSGVIVRVVEDGAALDLRGLDEAAMLAALAEVVIDRHPHLDRLTAR
jgi:hypothetical protein